MSFHEFGAKFFSAREVVDVDFEEMLEGFVGVKSVFFVQV